MLLNLKDGFDTDRQCSLGHRKSVPAIRNDHMDTSYAATFSSSEAPSEFWEGRSPLSKMRAEMSSTALSSEVPALILPSGYLSQNSLEPLGRRETLRFCGGAIGKNKTFVWPGFHIIEQSLAINGNLYSCNPLHVVT